MNPTIKNLPILTKNNASTIDAFIESWKKFYEGDRYNDDTYFNNLKSLNELNGDNIQKLFEWKNGMRPSDKKQESINKIKNSLDDIKTKFGIVGDSINELQKIFEYSCDNFFYNGYIFNIFFLHILKHDNCPIADTYVYRAYSYLCNGETESPVYDWNTYIEYRNFFNRIATETNRITIEKRKEIDEALWGFGKFLDNYPRIITDRVESQRGVTK